MVQNHSDMNIQIIDKLDDFVGLENIWNKLLRTSHFNNIFLTYEWFYNFVYNFRLVDKLFIIIINIKNDPIGILPLYRKEYKFFRINFRVLQSITNVHTPKFNFIIRSGNEHLVEKALMRLKELYSWDLIQLDYIIEGSYLLKKCCSGARKSFSFKTVEKMRSPHLIINCDWPEYWHKRFSGSLRRNIRKLENQAYKKFEIAFEHISGEILCSTDLDEAFQIEDSGWKGKSGTSILKKSDAEQFYRKIAFAMNSIGCFELFFLYFGGKKAAFEYCLKYNSFIYALKGGYDEKYKKYSPGSILRKMITKHIFMNQYQKYDLLGSNDPYKLKWTNGIDVLYSVYIFNRKFKSFILKFFLFDASKLASKLRIKNCLRNNYLKIRGLYRRKHI